MSESLFYQLIKISSGNAICLSRSPNADEWYELFELAKAHALVVCKV